MSTRTRVLLGTGTGYSEHSRGGLTASTASAAGLSFVEAAALPKVVLPSDSAAQTAAHALAKPTAAHMSTMPARTRTRLSLDMASLCGYPHPCFCDNPYPYFAIIRTLIFRLSAPLFCAPSTSLHGGAGRADVVQGSRVVRRGAMGRPEPDGAHPWRVRPRPHPSATADGRPRARFCEPSERLAWRRAGPGCAGCMGRSP